MAGAPKGNQNAAKAKVWSAAIERALERRKPADERIKAIDELADKLLEQCLEGNLQAMQELGNRLEGKPGQSMMLSGADGGPVEISYPIAGIPSKQTDVE
jgi:hypothetical protein